jgi:hypothetical protein
MNRYLIIILIVLPLGFGVGYFNNQYQEAKCPPNPYSGHHWGGWEKTGRQAAWPSNKMLISRQCVHCKAVETKTSN